MPILLSLLLPLLSILVSIPVLFLSTGLLPRVHHVFYLLSPPHLLYLAHQSLFQLFQLLTVVVLLLPILIDLSVESLLLTCLFLSLLYTLHLSIQHLYALLVSLYALFHAREGAYELVVLL